MRPVRPHGGRHDDREGGSDAQLHADLFGHAEEAEDLEQHRNDHRAAADPEQSGKQAGDDPGSHYGDGKPNQLGDRHPRHGSAAAVAAQQLGQFADALPFLAVIDGVLDAAHPIRTQDNAG